MGKVLIGFVALMLSFVTPAVAQMTGGADDFGRTTTREQQLPIDVSVGIRVMQITGVDQKAENFTVVARLRMDWREPLLAFDPADWPRGRRVMSTEDFVEFARAEGIVVPVAIYENLQARSFSKESAVAWDAEGHVFHASESILTLQAPDFDFRQYPFDRQKFFVRLLLNAPEGFFALSATDGLNGMGDVLGEEEWIVRDVWTEVDVTEGIAGWNSPRFSLGFEADRHLIYYWMRLFIPLLLLVAVSWANLFLEEYRRRIDIAGANLLAFIAFNFMVSGELPRLGYLTFIDALLMAMFVLSALTVVYNVMLRRMAVANMEGHARSIDWHVTHWGYPTIYVVTVLLIWSAFFP